MALKLKTRTNFPALVSVQAPLLLSKIGSAYTFSLDMDSLISTVFVSSSPRTLTGTSGAIGTTDSSIIFNASGAFTVTLPNAALYPGRWLNLKSIAVQTVNSASTNVVPLAGGAAGTALLTNTAGKWARLQSDGANWIIMAAN